MSANCSLTVSIVIPTLNAAPFLPPLMKSLFAQEPLQPMEVVLVDSMSTDDTSAVARSDPRIRLVSIRDFSHGRARNLGAREAKGEIVVMMTQDVMPADRNWLARLLQPLEENNTVAAFSRQIPRPDASPMERFFLADRFPDGPIIVKRKSGNKPAILEQAFFSDVSAAFRREVLLKYPFDETLIMSEDQQFSRDVQEAGYAVAYQPSSIVIHSHNYTLRAAFKRYFDSVYSLTVIFKSHGIGTSTSMGTKYLRKEVRYIATNYPWYLPYYAAYNCAKIGGTLAAHLAPVLPRWLLRRISLHNYHWR
jgi:rhamnosyltransferase